jgi:cation/acetate symporter
MIVGIVFTLAYIIYFKFVTPEHNNPDHWLFGISPEGIGTIGMLLNFFVAQIVARFTPETPLEVQQEVEQIRVPRQITH